MNHFNGAVIAVFQDFGLEFGQFSIFYPSSYVSGCCDDGDGDVVYGSRRFFFPPFDLTVSVVWPGEISARLSVSSPLQT